MIASQIKKVPVFATVLSLLISNGSSRELDSSNLKLPKIEVYKFDLFKGI